jgi:hypothetical protein
MNTSQISISYWAKPATRNTVYRLFVKNGDYVLRANSGNMEMISGIFFASTGTYTTDWEHWVFTADGTNYNWYRNGVLDTTTVRTWTVPSNNNELYIGGAIDAYSGSLDDLRIYNRALTLSEIKQLYNVGEQKINTTITSTGGNLESGLVGYWPFDGKYMTPNVRDVSGQGNHGNLSGQTSTTTAIGKIGQAVMLDGVNDVVDAGSASTLDNIQDQGGGGMSVAGWILPRVSSGVLWAKGTGASFSGFWGVQIAAGNRLQFTKEGSTDLSARTATNSLTLNVWQHIAVVWNGGTTAADVKFYVDGVARAHDIDIDGVTFASDALLSLGLGAYSNAGTPFNGLMDDVRFYNRALSADEIKQLVNLAR